MAEDNDSFEEASLDDFFQPPAEEAPAAPRPRPAAPPPPPVEDASAFESALSSEPADLQFESSPIASPQPQVEDLPITNLGGGGTDKKKIIFLAGVGVLVLLLLAGGAYFFLFSEEPAPKPVAKEIAATTPPALPTTPPPTPALKVKRLGDLERSPSTQYVQGSKIFDAAAGALSQDGAGQLGALSAPYHLYVGTFVVGSNLEEAKGKVRAAGLTPRVREEQSSITMHRLHVGGYDSRSAAERAKGKLAKSGFDAFVIKESRTSYQVYAGSFFTQTKAKEYQSRLFDSGSGFVGELTDVRVEMPTWQLWAGTFQSVDEVASPLKSLLEAGIEVDVAGSR